jgi:DNA polymerase-1
MDKLRPFSRVWLADFEFCARPGERPGPLCLVAYELLGGRKIRIWLDGLSKPTVPPYDVGEDSLFVSFFASAELGCHLALDWPMPVNILDLYVEFRNLTNGSPVPCGNGLLGALAYFGLDTMQATEKDAMRQLAMRGGPWTKDEQRELLEYCEDDVRALERLLGATVEDIDMPRALIRGRFMTAVAGMEHVGVPIDVETLDKIRGHWFELQDDLIAEIDKSFGVFDGRTFRRDRWAAWLIANNVPWPRLASGELALDDDTFCEMAKSYPRISPIRELRHALSDLRLADLAVGADGRNRSLLSPFRAKTGRNQPSTSRFIFGPAVWLRGLIQPPVGWGVAYIDWSQQEFGIAAALSGDPTMSAAYQSGDPYLEFAKQAGAAPANATKQTHSAVRDLFKACALAVQYGMGEESLALRIGKPIAYARELLRLHRSTYPAYWRWSDAAVDVAMLHGQLRTVFGWTIRPALEINPRSLRNFPMQANGAEALRLACIFATERNIRVCAPVHDALLIEAPLAELDEAVAITQAAMERASRIVLAGFTLRSEVNVVRHPDRYADSRGREMWERVMTLSARYCA